ATPQTQAATPIRLFPVAAKDRRAQPWSRLAPPQGRGLDHGEDDDPSRCGTAHQPLREVPFCRRQVGQLGNKLVPLTRGSSSSPAASATPSGPAQAVVLMISRRWRARILRTARRGLRESRCGGGGKSSRKGRHTHPFHGDSPAFPALLTDPWVVAAG